MPVNEAVNEAASPLTRRRVLPTHAAGEMLHVTLHVTEPFQCLPQETSAMQHTQQPLLLTHAAAGEMLHAAMPFLDATCRIANPYSTHYL